MKPILGHAASCQQHFGHDQWQLVQLCSAWANSEEHVCKDEWSSYCWDKSWGSCPVVCTSDEAYCYSYVYDSTGRRSPRVIARTVQCLLGSDSV